VDHFASEWLVVPRRFVWCGALCGSSRHGTGEVLTQTLGTAPARWNDSKNPAFSRASPDHAFVISINAQVADPLSFSEYENLSERVVLIRINRLDRRNAMGCDIPIGFADSFTKLREVPGVSAAVLIETGKCLLRGCGLKKRRAARRWIQSR
jgi:hypothetical protein